MNFDNIVEEMKKDLHQNYNGMYLSKRQIEVLNKYHFNYQDYHDIKELMFDLDSYLNENNNEELEIVLVEIAEYNYYANTHK